MRARIVASVDVEGNPRIEVDPYVDDKGDQYARSLSNAFNYANKLSDSSKRKVIIMIDEFQHIIDYNSIRGLEGILDIFRIVLEKRTNVSFIVSGSRVHYLKNILGDGSSPLFGHFAIIDVNPLEKKHAVKLFARSNRFAMKKRVANYAFEKVGGHPHYLVMLAEGRKKTESVEDAYLRLLTTPTGALYLYVNYILAEHLGTRYKNDRYADILESLSGDPRTVSQIARDAATRMTDMPKLLNVLIEHDIVEKHDGRYMIRDVVVRGFFRMRRDDDRYPHDSGTRM